MYNNFILVYSRPELSYPKSSMCGVGDFPLDKLNSCHNGWHWNSNLLWHGLLGIQPLHKLNLSDLYHKYFVPLNKWICKYGKYEYDIEIFNLNIYEDNEVVKDLFFNKEYIFEMSCCSKITKQFITWNEEGGRLPNKRIII